MKTPRGVYNIGGEVGKASSDDIMAGEHSSSDIGDTPFRTRRGEPNKPNKASSKPLKHLSLHFVVAEVKTGASKKVKGLDNSESHPTESSRQGTRTTEQFEAKFSCWASTQPDVAPDQRPINPSLDGVSIKTLAGTQNSTVGKPTVGVGDIAF